MTLLDLRPVLMKWQTDSGWWFLKYVLFSTPSWAHDPLWLIFFQRRWFNHQLVNVAHYNLEPDVWPK